MPALVPVLRLRKTGRVQFAGIPAQGNKMKCQGDHGGCRAKYRCCLPALAGFLSPHSMGPGAHNKAAPPFRFKEKRASARESASKQAFRPPNRSKRELYKTAPRQFDVFLDLFLERF